MITFEKIYDYFDDLLFSNSRARKQVREDLNEPEHNIPNEFNSIFPNAEAEQSYYEISGLIDGDKLKKKSKEVEPV